MWQYASQLFFHGSPFIEHHVYCPLLSFSASIGKQSGSDHNIRLFRTPIERGIRAVRPPDRKFLIPWRVSRNEIISIPGSLVDRMRTIGSDQISGQIFVAFISDDKSNTLSAWTE